MSFKRLFVNASFELGVSNKVSWIGITISVCYILAKYDHMQFDVVLSLYINTYITYAIVLRVKVETEDIHEQYL